jgi:hypothetical protein
MIEYTEFTTESGIQYILRNNGNDTISWIPKDLENADYRQYLESLDE